PEASVGNPVDMIASATPESYARALEVVLDDPSVDMAMVINVTPLLSNPIDVLEAIAGAVGEHDCPVLAVMMATEEFYEGIKARQDLPPVYRFPEPAARVLAQLARYSAWRRRPADEAPPEFPVDDGAVEGILERTADGYLPAGDAYRVLELYGIPTAGWRTAGGPEAAAVEASDLGYPVVLKGEARDLVHKSDVGAVEVGLESADQVREAARAIEARLEGAGQRLEGFLIQEMVADGHEVIFGISTDPRFGPLLMFGLGGRYVEVFRDVRFGVTPLTRPEAEDMIRGIRGFGLLEGVRGEEPADLDLLAEVLLRLAQLAQRHPRIRELDVNPFLAAAERDGAKAVDVRLRVGEPPVAASP
ncbi:MAG: acetate--CoA ligase family protein, partial [Acidobacteriota bacterium]